MAKKKLNINKNKRRSNKNKRYSLSIWKKGKNFILAVLCLCFFYVGYDSYNQGYFSHVGNIAIKMFYGLTVNAGFGVEHIFVNGRKKTSYSEIVNVIDINKEDSIFSVSLQKIREKVEKISSVKSAIITRSLPNIIEINIIERVPFAIWQINKKLFVIDESGVVLDYEKPDNYSNLLVVVGAEAPKHIKELISLLSTQKHIANEVIAAIFVGERRWNIKTSIGTEIMLPADNPQKAWLKFGKMQQNLLQNSIHIIDMRIDGKIFIKYYDKPYIENNYFGKNI